MIPPIVMTVGRYVGAYLTSAAISFFLDCLLGKDRDRPEEDDEGFADSAVNESFPVLHFLNLLRRSWYGRADFYDEFTSLAETEFRNQVPPDLLQKLGDGVYSVAEVAYAYEQYDKVELENIYRAYRSLREIVNEVVRMRKEGMNGGNRHR